MEQEWFQYPLGHNEWAELTSKIQIFKEHSMTDGKHMRNPHHIADRYKTIHQGAATSIWCSISHELGGMGGVYCEDCNIAVSVPANSTEPFGIRPWAIVVLSQ